MMSSQGQNELLDTNNKSGQQMMYMGRTHTHIADCDNTRRGHFQGQDITNTAVH